MPEQHIPEQAYARTTNTLIVMGVRTIHGFHQSWKVLEFFLKFWKSPGFFLWLNSPKERFLNKHSIRRASSVC